MCAANTQMVSKVAELMELRKMIEDLNAEAELIADEIKAYMGEEETMTAGSYVVRYTSFLLFKVVGASLNLVSILYLMMCPINRTIILWLI